jgi:hypothetical protein
MPDITHERGGRLVICNLQKTPLDATADLVVHARCDELMRLVMEGLAVPVPAFILHRFVSISLRKMTMGHRVTVQARDVDGTPASIFKQVDMQVVGASGAPARLDTEPFDQTFARLAPGTVMKLRFYFRGNYGEPNLPLTWTVPDLGAKDNASSDMILEFDPIKGGDWYVYCCVHDFQCVEMRVTFRVVVADTPVTRVAVLGAPAAPSAAAAAAPV